MPGDRIDRFHLAPVALGRPGVQQHALAGDPGRTGRVEQRQVTRPGGECPGWRGRGGPGLDRLVRGQPGLVATVEDLHLLVPEVAQQPPGPGGRHRVILVVDHHRPVVVHAGPAHRCLERVRVRQRVSSPGPGRAGQIAVQVHKPRAGQVTLAVAVEAGWATEPPPHIQQNRCRADRQCGRQRRGVEG